MPTLIAILPSHFVCMPHARCTARTTFLSLFLKNTFTPGVTDNFLLKTKKFLGLKRSVTSAMAASSADRVEEKGAVLFEILDGNNSGTLVGYFFMKSQIKALLQTCFGLFICRTSMNLSYLSRAWLAITPMMTQSQCKSV